MNIDKRIISSVFIHNVAANDRLDFRYNPKTVLSLTKKPCSII